MVNQQPISLRIQLLGGFCISFGEKIIPQEQFRLRKARSLLKILALAPAHRLHRDQLIELLWPDSDPEAAANSLYQVLYAARHVLAAHDIFAQQVLQFKEEFFYLGLDAPLWVDVEAFEEAAAYAHRHQDPVAYQTALDLYAGDLLPEDLYEDWATTRHEALHQEHQRLLLGFAILKESHQDFPAAIAAFQQALSADPACEEAHAGLMRLFALTNQHGAALAQYETCRKALEKELGVFPALTTAALYQQILDGTLVAQTLPIAQTQPAPSRRTHLPTYLIPFVGRSSLLAAVRARLADPACRLLSLTGPGGSGKTRLAVEAVSTLTAAFPDGIYFVPLAGLQSQAAIVPAAAQALEFSLFDASRDPQQQLVDYLGNKTLLLVLDNFEHLLAASALQGEEGAEIVTQILEAAPRVKVLVTSRARLDVLSETLLSIPGMRVPEVTEEKISTALEYSAVRLFLQGARRLLPEYTPTGADLEKILVICRLVRGMPLAILLAAGWLELLTPAEIAAEIQNSLDFLVSRSRDLPERQRSLRAIFDHSWRLLSEGEQRIFAAMSIFRGGFSTEAAKQVVGASLSTLAGLTGKSLIQRNPDGRLEIHELLRQFAGEQLTALTGVEQQVRDRHSRYFSDFLALRKFRLMIKNERSALEEVACEINNIRMAWDWAVEHGMLEEIERCRISLNRFYISQGPFFEGLALFEDASRRLSVILAAGGQGKDINSLRLVIAHIDQIRVNYGMNLRLKQQSVELARSSLAVTQELGDRRGEAECWRELGYFIPLDDPETGFLKSIRIYEELGDAFGKAGAMVNFCTSIITDGNDIPRAKHHLQEALAILREINSSKILARALSLMGNIYALEEMYSEAERYYLDAIAIFEKTANFEIAIIQMLRSRDRFKQGDVEKGKQLMQEGILLCLDTGNFPIAAEMYSALQYFCWKHGDFTEITQLVAEMQPILQRTHPPQRYVFEGCCDTFQGASAWSQGNPRAARRSFYLALQKFRLAGKEYLLDYPFIPMALFLAEIGQKELALELAELFSVASRRRVGERNEIRQVIADLEKDLAPEVVTATRESGRTRGFTSILDQLIAAWKEGE